jgi:hypothetical protein
MQHIVDKIHSESMILNSLIKEFKEKQDKVTLEKLEKSNEKVRDLLKEYGKMLKEQAEIFAGLPDILSPEDMARLGLDGKRKKRRSKKRSKKRRSKKSKRNKY